MSKHYTAVEFAEAAKVLRDHAEAATRLADQRKKVLERISDMLEEARSLLLENELIKKGK